MSSELRLKKLRGSGGYVMAQVTDEQQSKGNLGGPDLFLAPVGRIDVQKISKHFCNTCEKEIEGAPKIDFETPNEEVAENLVLVERGQYLCNTCGATIAEYREFKKSDEAQDIGLAKPTTAGNAARPEPAMEPAAAEQPVPAVEQPKPDASGAESISAIEGMAVFDENAKKLGTAKQVGVDQSQTVVLTITRDDGTETAVPWSRVGTIGEVVLLGSGARPPEPAQGKCPECGFVNKADAKFCEECGHKMA